MAGIVEQMMTPLLSHVHTDIPHHRHNEGPSISHFCFTLTLHTEQAEPVRFRASVITHSKPAFQLQIFRRGDDSITVRLLIF